MIAYTLLFLTGLTSLIYGIYSLGIKFFSSTDDAIDTWKENNLI